MLGIRNSNDYESAGAICTFIGASITFSGCSSATFINNKAVRAGAAAFSESNVVIEEHATITISNNTAVCSSGGALVCFNNSIITFKGSANVIIYSSKAALSDGAIHSYHMNVLLHHLGQPCCHILESYRM